MYGCRMPSQKMFFKARNKVSFDSSDALGLTLN